MRTVTCRIKEYIQPFERVLAFKELEAITKSTLVPVSSSDAPLTFNAQTDVSVSDLSRTLAYWEMVEADDEQTVTDQSLREATVNVVRNGIDLEQLRKSLPFGDQVALPNRRCLRYGTHGIHEYRGKFFPQLVRALINISGTGKGGVVLDPMSGSGTTVVEAVLSGCEGLGVDMNPLSSLLGQTKADLLSADPQRIAAEYQKIRSTLLEPEPHITPVLSYLNTLPEADQKYLKQWFAEEVLASLDEIAELVSATGYAPARSLMLISLSNIIRSISWQKDDDLRVRKDVRLDVEIDPKKEFLEELGRSVRAVLAFLYQDGGRPKPKHTIIPGDARKAAEIFSSYKGRVDVVITSPPYATALPYLDTDRLSLYYLGLLEKSDHRRKDLEMIGNREIGERNRLAYLQAFHERSAELPDSVVSLIERIDTANRTSNAGFRRKNLSALLAKYFFDMKEVLESTLELLKPGGNAYLVVGNNHTVAGGEHVDIATASLLSDIGVSLGFVASPSISMEMLSSRDIFRKNAMKTEEIICLRKPV
jgi:DNA modification methylase